MSAVALLDVNLLIALFDPGHVHHEPAHNWFEQQRPMGWATCPLTELGLVRIVSNASYVGSGVRPGRAVAMLREFCAAQEHAFWPDDLRPFEDALHAERLASSRQVTDAYLLALAVSRHGKLATFDRGIPLAAVRGAEPRHLEALRA